MTDTSSDLLMAVVGSGGRIKSEDKVVIGSRTKGGGLLDDFVDGYILELRDFDFEVGSAKSLGADKHKQAAGTGSAPHGTAGASGMSTAGSTKRGGASDESGMQPVKFTRLVNSTSIELFKAMIACETLSSIAIVKRKASGTVNSGEPFLRVDFTEALLISLDWKEAGDLVEEVGSFLCRGVQIRYRPQNANGALGSPVQYKWRMPGT